MTRKYKKKIVTDERQYSYKPTVVEKKLLEVLVNPVFVGAPVKVILKEADVSRARYYKVIQKPDFINLVNQMTKDLIGDRIYEVLNATYLHSLDIKNHNDRKLLLTMYGLFAEKSEMKLSGSVDTNIRNLSEEELAVKIKELEKSLGVDSIVPD